MKTVGTEKDNPLKRIQEEINEVARRERELREKMQSLQNERDGVLTNTGLLLDEIDSNSSNSPIPSHPSHSQEDTPSLASSVNSKESFDGHHSDDSGISASSSPIIECSTTASTEKKYNRPSYNSVSPSTVSSQKLTRTISTPQIFQQLAQRRIHVGPAQKGLMQRFIAARGKIAANNNATHNGGVMNNENGDIPRQFIGIPIHSMTPPIIERDSDGKPIRRGYIPVEEKIQRELKDLKNRESELKHLRKMRQSQPDLLDSIENMESDDDSDVEHCYPPGKLRSSKSISELCDSINSSSISPRTTPSPFERMRSPISNNGIRPAVSLASLLDDPSEQAISSHDLIAKFESLIQQNA